MESCVSLMVRWAIVMWSRILIWKSSHWRLIPLPAHRAKAAISTVRHSYATRSILPKFLTISVGKPHEPLMAVSIWDSGTTKLRYPPIITYVRLLICIRWDRRFPIHSVHRRPKGTMLTWVPMVTRFLWDITTRSVWLANHLASASKQPLPIIIRW